MPRSYSMTTRAAAAAAAQEQLLSAASDELVAVGSEGFTMQGVAKRADVALRTLYNYFPTRDDLLAATFERLAAHTRALIVEVDAGSGTPAERLRQFVERIYSMFEDEGDSLTMLLALRGVAALDDAVAEIRAWRRDQLTTLLSEIESDDGLAVPLPEAVAMAFVLTAHATWHSLAVQSGLGTATAKRLAADALVGIVLTSAPAKAARAHRRSSRSS